MHAIRLHAFGPPENLRYEEVDDPEPGPGQVRIAVSAAGVHFIDTIIRAGEPTGLVPEAALRRMMPQLPATPGREVAGVVDAVGDEADRSWLGRRVVAHLGVASGGYAELAVREVEALQVLPDGLSDAAAVAMPVDRPDHAGHPPDCAAHRRGRGAGDRGGGRDRQPPGTGGA